MAPEVETRIAALRRRVADARGSGLRVGCVPTMGALHGGHTALFDRARADCDLLVGTLFVNPLQFDRRDDLESYPRDMGSDLRICGRHGVDILFAPPVEEMYPRRPATYVEVEGLGSTLCGASRPGHFRGVATVVLKLLNIVQPHFACFGEKDYQQLAIIRRLVADANMPVEIVGVPTVREEDGVALSSRNALLSAEQRDAAPILVRTLRAARNAIEANEVDARGLCRRAQDLFRGNPHVRLDYFEIVDPDTLQPVERIEHSVRIAVAAFFGPIRLIDNLAASPPKAR